MTKKKDRHSNRQALSAVSAIALALAAPAWAEDATKVFNIEAQPLSEALLEFSAQSQVNVIAPSSVTNGLRARPVSGELTPEDALMIMLGDAELELYPQPNGSIVLAEVLTEAPRRDATFRMAQLDQEDDTLAEVTERREEEEDEPQDTIVVTGTNIRGIAPESSPVLSFDAVDIRSTGASTVEGFLGTITQNFQGGPGSENFANLSNTAGGVVTIFGGSGVNLRGLGAGSTLVLLNGRRVAPSGAAEFVDISLFPLSVVDRIEVLTVGASAIYGTDAIGGVVNIILADDFTGAETGVRFDTATAGDADQWTLSQSFGKGWTTGNAMIAVEYLTQDALLAGSKDFPDPVLRDVAILPDRERISLFGSLRQEITPTTEISLTGYYFDNSSDRFQLNDFNGPQFTAQDTEQYGGAFGLRQGVGATWQGDLSVSYSKTEAVRQHDRLLTGLQPPGQRNNEALNVDLKFDGDAFDAPAGTVKMAVGAQYRDEVLARPLRDTKLDRNVFAFFGEFYLPLVNEDMNFLGIDGVDLISAIRYEEYNDAGSTFDPQVGLVVRLNEQLKLRGSWGTSFKAPRLDFITGSFNLLGTQVPPDPPFLLLVGRNPGLKPEVSETYTIGMDLFPADGLTISATYYNAKLEDRVGTPPFRDVFVDDGLRSDIGVENPSLELLNSLIEGSLASGGRGFRNFTSLDLEDYTLLADLRVQNLSVTNIEGLDFDANYQTPAFGGMIGTSLSGTFLFKYELQSSPSAALNDRVGNVSFPLDLRLRGGVFFEKGSVRTNLFVNYADDYTDIRFAEPRAVDSFVTVDASFFWDMSPNGGGILSGTSLAFSVRNLFDQDPPFLSFDPLFTFYDGNIGYDTANASGVGRTVGLELRKRW